MGKDIIKIALDNTIRFIERKRELEKKNKERNLIRQVSKETMNFIERVRRLQGGSKPIPVELEKGKP